MVKKALFFRAEGNSCNLESLMECCRGEQFEIEDRGHAPDHEAIKAVLPETPIVLFVPAIEEDCLGVKLAQDALESKLPRVIVLYASSMPSREYLCLAFREGVDDIVTLDADKETFAAKVTRAARILRARMETTETGGHLQQKIKSLQLLSEQLKCRDAKWQERLLALSSTATRLATGQLRLAENAPSLLIVATSNSQATSAAELACQLGFNPLVSHTAKEAMEQIEKHPPQVILTDGTLPDMDARTFAHDVRKALGNKPAIIIAWSSSPETEEVLLAPDTGIDDFVLKSTTSEGGGLLAAALLGGLR